jgi:drug/metabolite transporter (DMT)-like permease
VGLLGVAPVTALLDVLFLGEPLSPAQIIGGILVLAGIFTVNRRSKAPVTSQTAGANSALHTTATPAT